MSTLRVDTLLNNAGNESPISVPGAAKAWITFDGTGTVSISDDYNVSSITDHGTGYYEVSFTNSMSNANYAIVLSRGSDGNTNPNYVQQVQISTDGPTTSGFRTRSNGATGGPVDSAYISAAVFS